MVSDRRIVDFSNADLKRRAIRHISGLQGLHWFELTRCRNQRSLEANGYYWSVVVPYVAMGLLEAWGEEKDSWETHEFLKDKFLSTPVINRKTGELKGKTVASSAALDTLEFYKYVESVIDFAARDLLVQIPAPISKYFREKIKEHEESNGIAQQGHADRKSHSRSANKTTPEQHEPVRVRSGVQPKIQDRKWRGSRGSNVR